MATPLQGTSKSRPGTSNKVHFCDCVFDMPAHQLLRAGVVVPLQPKMCELLEVLIERQPAVVTNEELDEILWPNVYVSRTSLARLVCELRALLGDSARDARIIRTVYKHGYSFCADVRRGETRDRPSSLNIVWRGQHLPLSEGEHILGRDALCDITIDAATVSRRHARLVVRNGNVTIEDMCSTNGTHIDGEEIHVPTPVGDGSEISLGGESMSLRAVDCNAITIVDRPFKHDAALG